MKCLRLLTAAVLIFGIPVLFTGCNDAGDASAPASTGSTNHGHEHDHDHDGHDHGDHAGHDEGGDTSAN